MILDFSEVFAPSLIPNRSKEVASSRKSRACFASKLFLTDVLEETLVLTFAGRGFFFAAVFLEAIRVASFLDAGRFVLFFIL